jgi:hypothetical protein
MRIFLADLCMLTAILMVIVFCVGLAQGKYAKEDSVYHKREFARSVYKQNE